MIEEEEEEDREETKKQNAEKILFAISKMNEKERQIWELYLQGMDTKKIAIRLGYKNMQGVYMVLRRSLWKVKIRM
jgi:DNA-directed RNA polymerase specialized sigma subunit